MQEEPHIFGSQSTLKNHSIVHCSILGKYVLYTIVIFTWKSDFC